MVKYYHPENTDSYADEMVGKAREMCEKYNNDMVMNVVLGFAKYASEENLKHEQ